jgi:hypothetical protein
MNWRIATTALGGVLLAAELCAAVAQQASGVVAALLAEGKIILVDVATGRVVAEHAAAVPPPFGITVGTLGQLGDNVFAVLPGADAPVLAAIEVRTRRGRNIATLPGDRYPGLAVGPRSRRVFAFGSRGAVIAVDPKTGEIVERISLPAGGDVYSGAVSADERRFYLSYHGRGSGVAWFDPAAAGWTLGGQLQTHGNFALDGNRILAAIGDEHLLEHDPAGSPRRVNTSLVRNHLMEFAVDRDRRLIYAVGSCGYGGGMSATPLPEVGQKPAQVLVPVGDYSTCGERVSLSADGTWLAVASRIGGRSVVTLNGRGLLLIVETASGAVRQKVSMSSDVVDVLAVK